MSDLELMYLLEENGIEPTANNLETIYLQEAFRTFLQENDDMDLLNEDILNEGKILNKIRWKLALFSLRFLKEKSINEFFMAYYADKDGNATEKGRDFCILRSKKEKLKRMRELANGMSEESKNKIINSQAAKAAEKSGVISLVAGGVSGAMAGITGVSSKKLKSIKADDMNSTELDLSISSKFKNDGYSVGRITHPASGGSSNILPRLTHPNEYYGSLTSTVNTKYGGSGYTTTHHINGGIDAIDGYVQASAKSRIGAPVMSILTTISSLLFGTMWASIILAGVSTARGIMKFHKADILRRDEIIAELKKKDDTLKESHISDLELMHILEESGYEPNIENLTILKEDDDIRYSLLESYINNK